MRWRRRRSVTCACGSVQDSFTSADTDAAPRDGDLSICWYCRGFAWYDSSRPDGLRPVTDAERDVLLANPRIRNLLHAPRRMTAVQAIDLIRGTS